MKAIGRIFDAVTDVLAFVASVILIAMMIATVIKVGLRVAFNHGILGIDQISGIMMVYMTFLGAAWVLRHDGHVTVDLLVANVPARVQRLMHLCASLIGAAVCLTAAWFGTNAVMLSLSRGVLVAAELEIPRAVNLAAIPVGFFLLGLEFLRRAVRLFRGNVPTPGILEV